MIAHKDLPIKLQEEFFPSTELRGRFAASVARVTRHAEIRGSEQCYTEKCSEE